MSGKLGRCPKCGRGRIETWGAEVTDIKDTAFANPVAELALLYVCSKCDWSMPVSERQRWRTLS